MKVRAALEYVRHRRAEHATTLSATLSFLIPFERLPPIIITDWPTRT
jgi:hypothetical protein